MKKIKMAILTAVLIACSWAIENTAKILSINDIYHRTKVRCFYKESAHTVFCLSCEERIRAVFVLENC